MALRFTPPLHISHIGTVHLLSLHVAATVQKKARHYLVAAAWSALRSKHVVVVVVRRCFERSSPVFFILETFCLTRVVKGSRTRRDDVASQPLQTHQATAVVISTLCLAVILLCDPEPFLHRDCSPAPCPILVGMFSLSYQQSVPPMVLSCPWWEEQVHTQHEHMGQKSLLHWST